MQCLQHARQGVGVVLVGFNLPGQRIVPGGLLQQLQLRRLQSSLSSNSAECTAILVHNYLAPMSTNLQLSALSLS